MIRSEFFVKQFGDIPAKGTLLTEADIVDLPFPSMGELEVETERARAAEQGLETNKQNKLTAGAGININQTTNTISATGGGSSSDILGLYYTGNKSLFNYIVKGNHSVTGTKEYRLCVLDVDNRVQLLEGTYELDVGCTLYVVNLALNYFIAALTEQTSGEELDFSKLVPNSLINAVDYSTKAVRPMLGLSVGEPGTNLFLNTQTFLIGEESHQGLFALSNNNPETDISQTQEYQSYHGGIVRFVLTGTYWNIDENNVVDSDINLHILDYWNEGQDLHVIQNGVVVDQPNQEEYANISVSGRIPLMPLTLLSKTGAGAFENEIYFDTVDLSMLAKELGNYWQSYIAKTTGNWKVKDQLDWLYSNIGGSIFSVENKLEKHKGQYADIAISDLRPINGSTSPMAGDTIYDIDGGIGVVVRTPAEGDTTVAVETTQEKIVYDDVVHDVEMVFNSGAGDYPIKAGTKITSFVLGDITEGSFDTAFTRNLINFGLNGYIRFNSGTQQFELVNYFGTVQGSIPLTGGELTFDEKWIESFADEVADDFLYSGCYMDCTYYPAEKDLADLKSEVDELKEYVDEQDATKQDTLSQQQLDNIDAVPNKVDTIKFNNTEYPAVNGETDIEAAVKTVKINNGMDYFGSTLNVDASGNLELYINAAIIPIDGQVKCAEFLAQKNLKK